MSEAFETRKAEGDAILTERYKRVRAKSNQRSNIDVEGYSDMEDEAIAEALSNANKRTQTYYSRGAVRKPGESAEQQAARKTKLAQQRSKNGKAVRAARGLKKRGSKVGSKHRGRKLKILDPEEPGISTTEKTIRKALRDASPL